MLVIRLSRTGKIHAPHYRLVVQEKRSKLNGKSIDVVGHYHPAQPGKLLVLDKEKIESWIKKGAQASDTVTNLFVKEGILPAERKVHHFFTPVKKEEKPMAKVEETPTEAEAIVEEEAKTEETPTVEESVAEVETTAK